MRPVRWNAKLCPAATRGTECPRPPGLAAPRWLRTRRAVGMAALAACPGCGSLVTRQEFVRSSGRGASQAVPLAGCLLAGQGSRNSDGAGGEEVAESCRSSSGASSAMWWPLAMGPPLSSVVQGLQMARTSPYRSARSSRLTTAPAWAGGAAAGGTVRLVCVTVDTQPGAVVIAHRPHGGGVVDRTLVVGMVLRDHVLRVPAVPGVGVGVGVGEDGARACRAGRRRTSATRLRRSGRQRGPGPRRSARCPARRDGSRRPGASKASREAT